MATARESVLRRVPSAPRFDPAGSHLRPGRHAGQRRKLGGVLLRAPRREFVPPSANAASNERVRIASDAQAIFCRRRHQPRRPPLAKRGRGVTACSKRAISGNAVDRVPEHSPPSVTSHRTADHSTPGLSFDAALIRGLTLISIL